MKQYDRIKVGLEDSVLLFTFYKEREAKVGKDGKLEQNDNLYYIDGVPTIREEIGQRGCLMREHIEGIVQGGTEFQGGDIVDSITESELLALTPEAREQKVEQIATVVFSRLQQLQDSEDAIKTTSKEKKENFGEVII